MWLERPQWDLVYLLGRWGLPLGQACARTARIPENRFSFKAGDDCGAQEGWVGPWLGAVSSLQVKKQNK